MQAFKDRVAVITGGASGIGKGMAAAFIEAGMKVVLADVETDRLAATVSNACRPFSRARIRCRPRLRL